ncbi:hypothetical protein MLD38_018401 [Melastoma candidum]|uniref:Uncharacterized protein n=1 Tax=Melastoma candidum TaxID=119954 RepID=A0ACB9QTQ9_9MYRT|nr:hypothetical protein MLD38_018401 [Melastoma candidum]
MGISRIALRNMLSPPRFLNTSLACSLYHAATPQFRRSFSGDTEVAPAEDTSSAVDVSRQGRSVSRRAARRRAPATALFSDALDPFFSTRSLSQVLNLMDHFFDEPFMNRNWDVKEDDDTLYLRMDMPGLSKEDVKVVVEHNTLVIRGEGQKEEGEGDESIVRRRYSGRIDLQTKRYKMDEIKAEMKHGVLKVVLPKVKDEEREGVVEVAVHG